MELSSLTPIIRDVYEPLHRYVTRNDVKEVVINQPYEVGLELRNGAWAFEEVPRFDKDFLLRMCKIFATASGQDFSFTVPQLSFKLPGGHRVQAIMGNFVPHGIVLSIRVHHHHEYKLESWGFSKEEICTLEHLIKSHKTVLVSGATSTGKTSLLNALLPLIDKKERIITIEGIPELRVPHHNWCPLYYSENNSAIGDLNVKDLLNASMRLRPDRILMGEIRKDNAYTFFHAVTSGHEGALATIHANDTDEALKKLAHYAVYSGDLDASGLGVFIDDLRIYINAVVQLRRTKENKLQGTIEIFS
ncbi:MAG: ATPase, T2SS/T4P/T4SS family [Alphaproteobacteria bacterium]